MWIFYKNIDSKAVYIALIPLLLPAVLDSNLYPIRATLCAYIELYLLFQIIGIVIFSENCGWNKIIILGIIDGILTAWRPENIVYGFGIVAILICSKKIKSAKIFVFFVCSMLIVTISAKVQNSGLSTMVFTQNEYGEQTMGKEAYSLSGFITSLGDLTMNKDFNSDDKDADISFLAESFDEEIFFNQGGMMAFWGGGLREISEQRLSELKKLYVKLIIYNPVKFAKSRFKLYLNTNFSNGGEILLCASSHIYDDFADDDDRNFVWSYREFRERYIYNISISINVRSSVINLMEGKTDEDYNGSSSWMVNWFWNVTPIAIALFFIWIYELKNKAWDWVLLIGCLVAKFAIVFLSAPTPFFMYYFSTYIVGGITIVFWIIMKKIEGKRCSE